jgi:flavorubredoxin
MITELKKNLYWVGVVDWGLRHFHGHELSTHRGSSYNAYLIRDEKTVLVDTVWGPFADDFMANLREVCDPGEIDIIVSNHSETDHAGALPLLLPHAPQAELIVSKRGADSLPGNYHQDWNLRTVATGDSIEIGENTLTFIEAPMLHWPDSMFTYVGGMNVLMPNDAFGQHYATAFRFNDQVNQKELFDEALKYYANILTPFSKLVGPKIDELLSLDVPVEMIAPSHGVIWRDNPMQIVEKYRQWSSGEPETYAVILYDTMWHATRRMAEAIGDGLTEAGVDHKLFSMSATDRNDALVEVFKARTLVVGSPTLNNGPLPTISPILIDIKGLKFANKLGAAFGSYGWSGESVRWIEEQFKNSGIPLIREGIKCKWQPTAEDLDGCRAFGREIGQATTSAT